MPRNQITVQYCMTLLTLSQLSAMTLLLTATENPEAVSTYIYWLIAAVVVIILLAAFLIVFMVRNQSLKKANKRLEADIIELKEYGLQMRDTLVAWNENNLSQATTAQSAVESQSQEATDEESPYADDPDWHLYMKLENRLMKDSLFLNPKLSRDDLAAMMGVDKNRFGNIMRKYSGASSCTVYLNKKRIDHAMKLMDLHPNFTIDAIAKLCGMTNTVTFINYFKRYYNMTPSEYRAQQTAK